SRRAVRMAVDPLVLERRRIAEIGREIDQVRPRSRALRLVEHPIEERRRSAVRRGREDRHMVVLADEPLEAFAALEDEIGKGSREVLKDLLDPLARLALPDHPDLAQT